MRKIRNVAARLLVWVMMAAPLSAQADASADQARQLMDTVGHQALDIIGNASLNKDEKQKQLEVLFSGNVDIPWVGHFVLGRYWRDASEEQRAHYLQEYEKFITANYAGRFADYTGGSYKITNATDEGDGQYTVAMQMISPDRQQVMVDYRLHTMPGGELRIFDVVVEGVSLITTQRSEFASVLGNKGLDYLIQQMANKAIQTPLPGEKKTAEAQKAS